MELLIVRHGEVQGNTLLHPGQDNPVTTAGMRQISLTAQYLFYNFKMEGYKGLTSPSLSCLQTASILSTVNDVPFTVEPLLRDYLLNSEEGLSLADRSVPYQNLQWPKGHWTEESKFYEKETVDEFMARMESLLYALQERGYDKALLVSHATPSIVLAELASGRSKEDLKRRCEKVIQAPELHEEADLNTLVNVMVSMERHIFLTSMKPCSITYVKDGKPELFSKIVYE
jgi:broad specificity phosphatase PhoE